MLHKIKTVFIKKRYTPKELRESFGALTSSNETTQDLINGADRQWKRYFDREFSRKQFNHQLKLFMNNRKK